MVLKCVEGNIQISLDEVILIESDKHKNLIIMQDGSIFHIYCKLDDLELRLKEHGFIRAHKSYLVNSLHIKKLLNYKMTLDNNMIINVPRGRYQCVKNIFFCNCNSKEDV